MPPRKHQDLMTAAVQRDGDAQRALLAGDRDAARRAFADAAGLYRQSWEVAPRTAYGRLVGMLKSSTLAGGGSAEAEYVLAALPDADLQSATASYARALAALIMGLDEDAQVWAVRMSAGGDAFVRTAEAIAALAGHAGPRFEAALEGIVRDFERRAEHLTGVAIADTALMLEVLAARRGVAVAIESPVLPALR
ncbi:MAG: hypothetical protein JOY56_06520 [Solirubrobacterales bacterium]|nr:hypothetical protein [Solirubrobacterales bacterium]